MGRNAERKIAPGRGFNQKIAITFLVTWGDMAAVTRCFLITHKIVRDRNTSVFTKNTIL